MRLFSLIGKGVLGLVTVLAVIGAASTLTEMGENREYYQNSIVTAKDFTVEPVDVACDLGYSAYEVRIFVSNDSRFSAEDGNVWRTYEGKDYDDVRTEDTVRYNSLRYAGTQMIPAGRQTVLKDTIFVRDGLRQVKVTYSVGYQDDNHEETLEIPKD